MENEVRRVSYESTIERNSKRTYQASAQGDFRNNPPSKWSYVSMYETLFNGYCFSCNDFGHKALNCKFYTRREFDYTKNVMRCWKCNKVGQKTWDCKSFYKSYPSRIKSVMKVWKRKEQTKGCELALYAQNDENE